MKFYVSPYALLRRVNWRILLGCIILLVATLLVYVPVWNGQFLWDDEFLVKRNPFIRSPILALEIFNHFLFTDVRGEFYRPIQNLSYIIDYWRAGLNASAFHQTNIFIHSLNAVLVFLLTKKLILKFENVSEATSFLLSFCIAIFWLLHPVHSAVVAYISGRADSLALAGMLSAWLFWEKGITALPKAGRKWFLFAVVSALVSCCSKEIALAGLGLFVIYVWVFSGELKVNFKVKSTVVLLAIIFIYLAIRQLPNPNIASLSTEILPLTEKIVLFFRAIGDYARLIVYPDKLFMERQVSLSTGLFTNPIKNDPLFPYLGWIGLVSSGFLLLSLFLPGKGRQLRLLGAIWFLVMILPVSNLFALNATVAEHWLYIPSIGFGLWLTGCWVGLPKKICWLGISVAPVLLILLACRANERAADWKDAYTFYRATIRDGGDSIRVRMNLAGEYQKMGQLIKGERIYQSILQVAPDYTLAKEALTKNQLLQKIIAGKNVISQVEQPLLIGEEAENLARQDYEKNPNSWEATQTLIKIYSSARNSHATLQLVKGFAERNWWHAESHNLLGELLVMNGDVDGATEAYRQASLLDLRDAEPLNQIAVLLAQKGKYSEALIIQEKAVSRNNTVRQIEIFSAITKMAEESASAGIENL